ncbi:MAG: hypothetical protein GXY83_34300 [Rhodopirellula sp.]|nr:hypothetical protein [Rhodopirellula sp.]
MRLPDENTPFSPPRGIDTPRELVEKLRGQIARLEQSRCPCDQASISSGCEGLDQLLPETGFRSGTLVEWLAEGDGAGAETLALIAARSACGSEGVLVVLDDAGQFYPPAALRLGLRQEQMILVHPADRPDFLWAMDQALRCPGVAAVLGRLEKLDGRTFRRWQLAAEQGGVLGLLVRPTSAGQEPSWADVRLLIEPRPSASKEGRRLKIQVLRSRGQTAGESIEVEVDDETHTMHLVARLDRSAIPPRATGA